MNVQYQLWCCDWFSVGLEKSGTTSIADKAQKNMINCGNVIILTSQAPLYCYSPNQIFLSGPLPQGKQGAWEQMTPYTVLWSGSESDFLCLDGSDTFVVIYTVALDLGARETEVCCHHGKFCFFPNIVCFHNLKFPIHSDFISKFYCEIQ